MSKNVIRILVVALLICCVLFISLANANRTNDSNKYTFDNYGREVYTPEPMEFGANLINGTTPENASTYNETERKHVLLQFYANPNEEQRELLKEYGVQRVGVAADYTYIVSIPANLTPADLPDESGLRWMGEIPVENKYDRNYGLHVPEWAKIEDGQAELWIAFYDDVTYEEAQAIANKYSTSLPKFKMYPYSFNCIIKTNESNIPIIATEDLVKGMSFPEGEFVDENSVSSKTTSGFQFIFSLLSLSITILFLRRRNLNDK
ncbi:hypothetical protein V7O62_06725 [Methanolobus sp. ZRKC2]|uniref:hypothetical protein n=1 Tax=Methanolobus sp. ZRKC2 TaxID=3125783 RepID=UPI003252DB1A